MCGILALFDNTGGSFDPESIARQCRTMAHRGPDDEGYHFQPGVALGMRRLSIVDVAGGHQPIANEDGGVWVVMNGEIYNHRELRRRLAGRGHHFKSRTDTEVIVHLYEEMGDDCVHELDGMFAFALWDARKQRLLCARDRLGIKPLYYTEYGHTIAFASEIKALIEDPSVERAVNLNGLHHYLGYLYVPAPETMFQGIYKLPPGHLMVCDARGHTTRRYWDLRFAADQSMTLDHATSAVHMQLRRSVEQRLMSEVPLGAYLSGGIDSSVIVALMAELMDEPVKTFNLSFGGEHEDFNEANHARDVARLFRTEHHEFEVREHHVAEILWQAVWYFDEPFGDGLHTYFLSQMAKQHVTVALTGLGSDELFGGYGRQARLGLSRLYTRAPALARRSCQSLLERLPPAAKASAAYRRARRVIDRAALSDWQYYAGEILMTPEATRRGLYTDGTWRDYQTRDLTEFLRLALDSTAIDHDDEWHRIAYLEHKTTMVEDFLHYADRMGMAHSMELRVPFLDHHMVELAGTIPAKYKVRGLRGNKYVLKKMAESLLPERIVYREKQPFFLPLDNWLRDDLADYVRRVLEPEKLAAQGYFDAAGVRALLDEHEHGHADRGWSIWALLVFQAWHDRFIERHHVAP
jgi:asparagine synthase (glutamine-hydrolysing)